MKSLLNSTNKKKKKKTPRRLSNESLHVGMSVGCLPHTSMETTGVEPVSKHIGTSKSTLIVKLFGIRLELAV